MEIHFSMCTSVLKTEFSDDVGKQQLSHSCLLPRGIPSPGVMSSSLIRQEDSGGTAGSCLVCSAEELLHAVPRRVFWEMRAVE